jgi:hypothetical protein
MTIEVQALTLIILLTRMRNAGFRDRIPTGVGTFHPAALCGRRSGVNAALRHRRAGFSPLRAVPAHGPNRRWRHRRCFP